MFLAIFHRSFLHFVLIYRFWCKMFQICLGHPRNSSRTFRDIPCCCTLRCTLQTALWVIKSWPSSLENIFFFLHTACWLYFFSKSAFPVLLSVLFGAERVVGSPVEIKISSSLRYTLHPGNISPAGEKYLYQINTGSHKSHF